MNDLLARENDVTGPVFVAGSSVSPGSYVNIETGRVIVLARKDTLPATLDGRVATYVRRPQTWAEISRA